MGVALGLLPPNAAPCPLAPFLRAAARKPTELAAYCAGPQGTLDISAHLPVQNAPCREPDSPSNQPVRGSVSTTISQKGVTSKASNMGCTDALSASNMNMVHRGVPLTWHSIMTNLSATNFKYLLSRHQLHAHYPSLITCIQSGFPIALDLPTLSATYTPPNHFKSDEETVIVQSKVDMEVELGHLSGPFTTSQASDFLGGHFRTCPLSLVPKSAEVGVGWHFSHKDKDGVSVNNSDDFPTTWISTQEFADWVSYIPYPVLGTPAFGCTLHFVLQPRAVPHTLRSSLMLYPALRAPASGCTLCSAHLPQAVPLQLSLTILINPTGSDGPPRCSSSTD